MAEFTRARDEAGGHGSLYTLKELNTVAIR